MRYKPNLCFSFGACSCILCSIGHRSSQAMLRRTTLPISKRELPRCLLAKEYRAMEIKQSSLQQGIEAAQRGDRERAYQLIRQAILEDSQHAPAWYYMSFL